MLGNDIFVNAPVNEPHCLDSPFTLDWNDSFHVTSAEVFIPVTPVPEPTYYGSTTSRGLPCSEVAQMCSADRVCYSLTGPTCSFWPRRVRCAYCSIGLNTDADARKRTEEDLLDVITLAAADPSRPARHVLLGGGTPLGPDMGAVLSGELASRIWGTVRLPSYVMIAAPLEDHYIEDLLEAGVQELGINLEFWDDESWRRYIPGKRERIGKSRYLDAIAHAGATFGPIRARSIVIAGLEPPASTLRAVEELASRGVMPIISPFRPLVGTELAKTRGFSATEYQQMFVHASLIAERFQLPLGPVCIPCQNNVLALPPRSGGVAESV